ncbi:unnamed protein product [Brassica rapa]|uniref:Leucine-rich repeat-containing N-terminal plant-type domain-containing protein n=1 Tax=Brassica campestris TaxID=3711 RepID=A0A8D9GXY8_BRACM|nr:unnamed protein product [Brassica rapa]
MHSCGSRKIIVWSLCLIFSLSHSILVWASSPPKHLCRQDQRDALWEFKSEFHLSGMAANEKTQTWRNNSDCCSWDGITCDPKTGNVLDLNLWSSSLNGPLRSSSGLFKLQYLQSLNLSSNNLAGILPDSIGNLKYLKDLRLSECNLFGQLPNSLGNLSDLTHLELDGNGFTGELPLSIGNLKQLTKLLIASSKLSGNFHHTLLNLGPDWFNRSGCGCGCGSLRMRVVAVSSGFKRFVRLVMRLEICSERFGAIWSGLERFERLLQNASNRYQPQKLRLRVVAGKPVIPLTELTAINLVSNQLEGTLPSNMSTFSKLEYFNVGSNSFSGSVPSSLFMISSLTYLNLERNHFNSLLEIGNISSPSKLQILSLGGNKLSGPIPGFISKLVELSSLDLSFWDTLRGDVDFSIFLHLKSLTSLDISTLNTRSIFSSTLHMVSPIGSLALASCNISEFPKFLRTQTSLFYLDISQNQIKGQVPEWLWSLPGLEYEIYLLDISWNAFKNPFPLLPKSITFLSASDNQFSGEILKTICQLDSLETLVLSNNNFSGFIPRCFEKFNTTLTVLHLQNNSLSGEFPEESVSVGLISLDVGHNQLSGELPKSLMNCTGLEFLNVEENKFNDTFPFWLRVLPGLQFLVLRSNEFHGPIYSPEGSINFPKLRIFDISKNLFSGALPSDYFFGWSEMSSGVYTPDNKQKRFIGIGFSNYVKSVVLANKGLEMKLLGTSFNIYKSIDVSGNRFQGEIPKSIGLLKEMIVLNMSNNAFIGSIPPSLSNLTNLQSLDLSRNRLSGKIPPELGKLTFLAWMNFSYNNLEGPIPQGTQIQTQDSSSFLQNPGLCGAPLQKTCSGGEEATINKDEEEDQVLSWIAAAIAYVPGVFCGFVVGHILASYRHDWFKRIFHCFS